MAAGTVFFIVLIAIIVITVLLSFFSKVLRFVLPILYFILIIVGTVMVFSDAADLRDNFLKEDKLFVLEMNNEATAAFTVKGTDPADIITDLTNIKAVPYEDLGYYKVLVFTWDSFETIDSVPFSGRTLTRAEAQQIMDAAEPRALLAQQSDVPIAAVNQAYVSDDMVRGDLFANLASAAADEESVVVALHQGTVSIVPETISFKLIKILPLSIVKKLLPEDDLV